MIRWSLTALLLFCAATRLFAAAPKPKPHNLPPVDLKQPVIWGSTAQDKDGVILAFGGLNQSAPDGIAHTQVKIAGKWVDLYDHLRKQNPLQPCCDQLRKLRNVEKELLARARAAYFEDYSAEQQRIFQGLLIASQQNLAHDLEAITRDLAELSPQFPYHQIRSTETSKSLHVIAGRAAELTRNPPARITPQLVHQLFEIQINIEQAAEALDCEPSPRALSPLLYRPNAGDFILFGGDHLDYLTNDTWIFRMNPYRWEMTTQRTAPPPRSNHNISLNDDHQVTISGGYTYANNTDYLGGQYLDRNDGVWTQDIVAREWTNPAAEAVLPNSRLYRTGPFHPDFFLDTDKPDAAKFQAFLQSIPANTWTKTNPPRLPKLNRDWGTAILDTNRDLILRWSGGHSAHGGTDVLHYHRATNRWELPAPVEFPLGQLYSNTSYPHGVSFNGRAWITGHTYQNYAFDPVTGNMIFTGQPEQFFPYDPDLEDWRRGHDKPKEMSYDSCFYTLTCTTTPAGIYCWTHDGKLFFYDAKQSAPWTAIALTGEKLLGAIVDNSTVIHDSRRNRLLFFRKEYGDKATYNGLIQSVDLKTLEVSTLTPENAPAASAVSYLCQIRYDPGNDLLLAGCTLPPDATGHRRTPAYDPAANRWISLNLAGDDPSGPKGRNVSLGLMYDTPRKLFWAVDTNSEVYVLRLNPTAADPQPLH